MNTTNSRLCRAFVFLRSPVYFGNYVNVRAGALIRKAEIELSTLLGEPDPRKYMNLYTESSAQVSSLEGICGTIGQWIGGRGNFGTRLALLDEEPPEIQKILEATYFQASTIPIIVSPNAWIMAREILRMQWGQANSPVQKDPPYLDPGQALIVIPGACGWKRISTFDN